MIATICYEIVLLVARTLNIILKIKKIVERFTSSGTDVGIFEFNFSPQIRTTICWFF